MLVEEPLDEIALAVECEIGLVRDEAVGLGWDDRGDSAVLVGLDEGVGVVGLVRKKGLRVDLVEQRPSWLRSEAWPGVKEKPTGLPKASTTAWILVISPPRERPMAWFSPAFFGRRRCVGEPARWLRPATCTRCRDHWPKS